MATTIPRGRFLRFGNFRLDRRSGELFRDGRAVRLPPQPAKLLLLLASSPGELVTREEIQKALWGDDTFVDFEQGVHKCIKQVRAALGDEAEEPVYIETVPRRGYRFVGKVEVEAAEHRSRRPFAAIPAFVGLLAVGAVWFFRPKAPPVDVRMPRFQLSLPRGVGVHVPLAFTVFAISPDGQKVAFRGCGGELGCLLYLRNPSEIDARALTGTEGAECPFFSPDGRWIAFGARGKLMKIDLETGAVVALADASRLRGGSWGEDGTILFSRGAGGLLRVSAEGGEVRELTNPDPERKEYDHRWPHHLPGGRAALFDIVGSASFENRVAVLDLETGKTRSLIENAGSPKYASGHLLFGRSGVVYAAPFDLGRLEIVRSPEPILEGVLMWSSPGQNLSVAGEVYYDVGGDGTLLFSPREARLPRRTLVLVDREGRREPVSLSHQTYTRPCFSPDGRRIAVPVEADAGSLRAFVLDIASDAWTQVGGEVDPWSATWMPDGERLLLTGVSGLFVAGLDGTEPPETLHVSGGEHGSAAPDGSAVLFTTNPKPGQMDIERLRLTEKPAAEPWLATPSWEDTPSFSPDGRFVVYRSFDSGRSEIYVRPYSGPGRRHQVSTHDGHSPRWSRDGSEIFFASRGGLWSARVRTSPVFSSEPPRKLFDLSDELLTEFEFYDVSPDGQRFVMVQKDPFELRPLDLVVVPGWIEEMKARLAAAK